MHLDNYLIIMLFVFSALSVAGSAPRNIGDDSKPNIILIMADDLGFETLGSYGSEQYNTPNLDHLAEQGMRFAHAYSTPLCTPSRVEIMTGQYNFRNYIGFGLLDPAERTFGHLLQDAGYVTGVAGKWQLLGNERQQKLAGNQRGSWPTEAGFDAYALWQVHKRGARYKDPLITSNDKGTQLYKDQYGPDIFLDFIEKFIEKNQSESFFLYYPMVLTHNPFQPTPASENFTHFDENGSVNDTTYFGQMVTYMDTIVGHIHDKIEELGIAKNTLLLFVGDNGTDRNIVSGLDGRKITGDKGYTTEYGTHVPLIAYWKDHIAPGQVNSNLIDFTDFLPSLLEAARYTPPEDFQTDGISFYPQLLGKSSATREWVFGHYDPHWGNWPLSRYVHDKRWKLYGDGKIYNIQDDPMEKKTLSSDQLSKEQQIRIEKFQRILNRLK